MRHLKMNDNSSETVISPTYSANVVCGNCGFINIISIDMKKFLKDHLRMAGEGCLNCKLRISSENYMIEPKGL